MGSGEDDDVGDEGGHGNDAGGLKGPRLRFRLGDIAVSVHWSFPLVALLGLGAFTGVEIAVWTIAVFVAILLHEAGHAFTARRFGAEPVAITLFGFGGATTYPTTSDLSPGQRFGVTAAGSGVGILAGGVLLLAGRAGAFDDLGRLPDVAVNSFVFASLVWGVLNWLPIRPLDGGQMTFTLVEVITPSAAEWISRAVSVLTGGVAVIVAVRFADYFAAFFVAFIVLVGLRAPARPGSGGLADKTPDVVPVADSHSPTSDRPSDRPGGRSRVRLAIWMAAGLLGMFTVVGVVLVKVVGPAVAAAEATSLNEEADEHLEAGRLDEAIAMSEEVVDRFGDHTDVATVTQVIDAVNRKSVAHLLMGEQERAIAVVDEAVARYGERTELVIVVQMANLLFHRASLIGLNSGGLSPEFHAAIDDLVARYGSHPEPLVSGLAASAVIMKATEQRNRGLRRDAAATLDRVVVLFGERTDGTVLFAAGALIQKGEILEELQDTQGAIAAYDEGISLVEEADGRDLGLFGDTPLLAELTSFAAEARTKRDQLASSKPTDDEVAGWAAGTTTVPITTTSTIIVATTIAPVAPSSTIATTEIVEELDVVFAERNQRNRGCSGDGSGSFTCGDVTSDANTTRGVALGDMDGDGALDAVFANRDQRNRVCSGDGSGRITCRDVSFDSNDTLGVALGDVNGDGDLDAVFAGNRNRVCLSNWPNGFTCRDISTDRNDSLGVALGDVDGDGNLDAVFANVTDSTVAGDSNRLCLGDGSGRFTCRDVSSDANISRGVALGDVDGDGDLDAVFANFGQRNRVCLFAGSEGFTCSDVSSDTYDTEGVALGDIDGDGHLDAVFANSSRRRNRVCLGTTTGAFAACSGVSSDINDSQGVALGDIDGDGNLDAVFANYGQPNRVCLGDRLGGFVCTPISGEANDTSGVAVVPAG